MPAWTAVTQYLLYNEKLSWNVYVTLIPIIGGAMMVCKEHQELWQVTEEELYQRACRNTRRILPEEFSAMKTVIMELSEAFLEKAKPMNRQTARPMRVACAP